MKRTTSAETLQELILAILDLAEAENATPIRGRVWARRIDDTWYLAVNGTDSAAMVQPRDSAMPHRIPVGAMAVWFGDWVAGELTFGGGWFAAHHQGASPDTFIEALEASLEEAK